MNHPALPFPAFQKARPLAALLALLASAAALHAQDTYVWNQAVSGYWTDAANWNSTAGGYPNAAGAVADLSQVDTAASVTVTFDANITVGTLLIGDTNNSNVYTLTAGSGAVMAFDSGSGEAAVFKTTAGANNTSFKGNISLLSDLTLANENTAAGSTGFFDVGGNGIGNVISAGSSGLKQLLFSGTSTKRINVYASIQDGDGQIGVTAAVYTLAGTSLQAVNFFSANTFTGGLTISGLLVAGNGLADATLGGQGSAITFDGGVLNFGGTYNSGNDNVVDRGVTLLAAGGILSPNSGHTISFTGAIDGAGALTKTGAGTIVLAGNNTYTGGTVVNSGTLSIIGDTSYQGGTTINSGTLSIMGDSSLGAADTGVTLNGGTLKTSSLSFATSARDLVINADSTIEANGFLNWNGALSGAGLLTKTGSSTFSLNDVDSTNSGGILVAAGGIRFRNGDGAFGAAGNSVTMAANTTFRIDDSIVAGTGRTLTLLSGNVNFYIQATSFEWQGAITGSGGLNKTQSGMMTLTGEGTYTGDTTVSVGTLRLGADNRIADVSGLVLKGGTFDLNGHSETMNTLTILSSSTLDLGDTGANSIVFADSSAAAWTLGAILSITGDVVSGQSIRVGTSASGLTSDQLSQILINGYSVGIDTDGYLTFVPESAAVAPLLGLCALLFVSARRRR